MIQRILEGKTCFRSLKLIRDYTYQVEQRSVKKTVIYRNK